MAYREPTEGEGGSTRGGGESCGMCGGDGRIANSFGLTARCPACHGSGRRSTEASGVRDVTKTKPSHHIDAKKAEAARHPTWPTTHEGGLLATEVKDSAAESDTKAKLIREIIEYEESHGRCTQTFTRKLKRKLGGG